MSRKTNAIDALVMEVEEQLRTTLSFIEPLEEDDRDLIWDRLQERIWEILTEED